MSHELAALLLCLVPGGDGAESKETFRKGVLALPCIVTAVHKDTLEVAVDRSELVGLPERSFRLKVTKATRLEQLDSGADPGMSRTKTITLADLKPEQPLSAIFYSDGKELTLLRAVTSAPPPGINLAAEVKKLGGKLKRLPWGKNRTGFSADLKGTKVTDDNLAALAQARNLLFLDLSFTSVTDRGVASLAASKDLDGLELAGTKVTDAVIADLRRFPSLSSINLAQTAVTRQGVARLVRDKSLTVCQIGLGDKARFRVHQQYVEGQLDHNYLMINDTYFGSYSTGRSPDQERRDRRRQATTYYHRHGPVGQVMGKLEWFKPASVLDYPSDARLPASLVGLLACGGPVSASAPSANAFAGLWSEPAIAVVRLNVGTHAAYGRPFQHIDFYNSTPELERFSLPPVGEPVYFGYVQDALKRGCAVKVIKEAERPTLSKKGPRNFYHAMFVEITRNDLRDINTDLLTQEAMAHMMDCLVEKGVLCFHTSHRYHDTVPAIVDAAASLKLAWKVGKDIGGASKDDRTHFGSEWTMIARSEDYLSHLTNVGNADEGITWFVPDASGKHLWRDGRPHDLKPLERKLQK
jgi:hypothetical protein